MTNPRSKRERCPIQGHTRIYFQRWDMFACLECDAWLSDPCGCPPADCTFRETAVPRDPSIAVKDGVSYEEI
jgi:hypothetical protein